MTVTSGITASDGVNLAVHRYTEIDTARPTILAIHGYPDNHHVWDAVAEQFCERYQGRYNVVGYDVRGAGESSRPAKRSGYAFRQLVSDIGAVIGSPFGICLYIEHRFVTLYESMICSNNRRDRKASEGNVPAVRRACAHSIADRQIAALGAELDQASESDPG